MEKFVKETLPAALEKLDKLLGDTKFICGDKVTQYDFSVAGVILNFCMYNEYSDLAAIRPCLFKCASEKVKTYVECFENEMGDYMKKRSKDHGKIRLHYFDLMGRAESIRMMLEYTGIHW